MFFKHFYCNHFKSTGNNLYDGKLVSDNVKYIAYPRYSDIGLPYIV